MNILNISNMNKNYVEIAKEKLQIHKSKGAQSDLSIFQVAELIDVINGKMKSFSLNNFMMFNHIGLN